MSVKTTTDILRVVRKHVDKVTLKAIVQDLAKVKDNPSLTRYIQMLLKPK
jgi:hypothetical protein